MSWPHELAHELAAFDPPKGQAPAGGWHGADTEGRVGANNEGARSDTAGRWPRRSTGGKPPRFWGSATEQCGGGSGNTRTRVSRDCWTDVAGNRAGSECLPGETERILAPYRDTMTFASPSSSVRNE